MLIFVLLGPSLATASAEPRRDLVSTITSQKSLQTEFTLVWLDQGQPYSFEAMAGEVERIYRDVGVRIIWRVAEPGAVRALSPESVVLYVFVLNEAPPGWAKKQETVMGAATTVPNRPNIIYVSFPNVLESLGLIAGSTQLHKIGLQRHVSVALGRVVAHEIVHALDPEIPHTAEGLMCRSLGRWFLTRGRPRLDPRIAATLRSRLKDSRKSSEGERGGYR